MNTGSEIESIHLIWIWYKSSFTYIFINNATKKGKKVKESQIKISLICRKVKTKNV